MRSSTWTAHCSATSAHPSSNAARSVAASTAASHSHSDRWWTLFPTRLALPLLIVPLVDSALCISIVDSDCSTRALWSSSCRLCLLLHRARWLSDSRCSAANCAAQRAFQTARDAVDDHDSNRGSSAARAAATSPLHATRQCCCSPRSRGDREQLQREHDQQQLGNAAASSLRSRPTNSSSRHCSCGYIRSRRRRFRSQPSDQRGAADSSVCTPSFLRCCRIHSCDRRRS